jgi:3-oxoacyl-(acyl-carrier-protein) synthase
VTGHLLGAAGALETIITTLAMRASFVPPTINQTDPDPECDLDYIPNTGREADVEYSLTNSFGFGGHNAVLVLRRWDAAGGIEAVAALMPLVRDQLPQSWNLVDPDADCALDYVTAPRAAAVDATVSNSFGFGGHNAVLVMARSERRA